MIKLRNGATAFLHSNGDYFLIKRAAHKALAPGVWSGVGGHLEPHEINDPLAACYREAEEETGIARSEITDLELRYIVTRRSGDEIRQNYIYFGETTQRDVAQTQEGTLHWVPETELLRREFTKSFTAMLEHFTQREPYDKAVYVGVCGNDDGSLRMHWSRCEDYEL